MYTSKFIQIFEKLTKPERLGFRKWARSPIANPREDVIKLVEFVLSKRAQAGQSEATIGLMTDPSESFQTTAYWLAFDS